MLTTEEKCKEIIKEIVRRCGDDSDSGHQVCFCSDWGGNSLTLLLKGAGHTHCGTPKCTFDEFVHSLYLSLYKQTGLSVK